MVLLDLNEHMICPTHGGAPLGQTSLPIPSTHLYEWAVFEQIKAITSHQNGYRRSCVISPVLRFCFWCMFEWSINPGSRADDWHGAHLLIYFKILRSSFIQTGYNSLITCGSDIEHPNSVAGLHPINTS